MNSFNLSDIKENSYFTDEVVIDKNFVLLSNSTPLTKSMIKALLDWDFKTIYSNGHIRGNTNTSFVHVAASKDVSDEFNDEKKVHSAVEDVKFDENGHQNEYSRFSTVKKVYDEYLSYINNVFKTYATKKELNYLELNETVKSLIQFVKSNKRYILRIQPPTEAHDKNFLINHAMRTTVFAILIAIQMHYPQEQMIELGVAGILHEIGMIRLPPQIYLTDRKLTQTEKNEIANHPKLSFEILKEHNFPQLIQLGVLEHHEKENGKGYPLKLLGPKITPYAKILAVACSYEAITAPRYYKDEKTVFDGMVELIKNENGQYDPMVIKSLLLSISFYPIGAYVFLNNGKLAQVSDANPESPKHPFVQLLTEKDENGNFKTIKTSENGLKIYRVLSKKEASDILASLSQTEN
ncbi:MAG: HD-GYP domain-containing protein [Treponemataceae bacterium]|nr:HD-GYP domain-containing protein [Spirochaetales bacterium]MDY6031465.1 HD-GYP domain-containing protein [Treponemataceae bacterium]